MSKKCICGTEISENRVYCTCCRAIVRYQDLPHRINLSEHLVKAHNLCPICDGPVDEHAVPGVCWIEDMEWTY